MLTAPAGAVPRKVGATNCESQTPYGLGWVESIPSGERIRSSSQSPHVSPVAASTTRLSSP